MALSLGYRFKSFSFVYLFLLQMKLSKTVDNDTDPNSPSAMEIPFVFEGVGPLPQLHVAGVDVLRHLVEEILTDYDVRIRPRVNQSHAVYVNVTFMPLGVIDLDTTSQKLDVLGVFGAMWNDELLYWDPDDYQGMDNIKLPLAQVWRPKLVILKAIKGDNVIGNEALDVVDVYSSSSVQHATVGWAPEGIYSVLCDLDVTYYPFDIQECQLTVYVSDEILENVFLSGPAEVPLSQYVENAEWKLLSLKSGSTVRYGTNMVSITFKLERRAQFTLFTMVLPLLMLSILDVAGLLAPVDCGEKITYMVTLFLTFCFSVFTMRDGLPHNSLNVSYFMVYLLEMSLVSVISVLYTIAQARIFQSRGSEVVRLFQRKEDPLPVVLRVRTPSPSSVPPSDGVRRRQPGSANRPGDSANSRKEPNEEMTWADLLRKTDRVLFALLLVLVGVFTCLFYGSVLNR